MRINYYEFVNIARLMWQRNTVAKVILEFWRPGPKTHITDLQCQGRQFIIVDSSLELFYHMCISINVQYNMKWQQINMPWRLSIQLTLSLMWQRYTAAKVILHVSPRKPKAHRTDLECPFVAYSFAEDTGIIKVARVLLSQLHIIKHSIRFKIQVYLYNQTLNVTTYPCKCNTVGRKIVA